MKIVRNRFWVKPGAEVSLKDWPTDDTAGTKKAEGRTRLVEVQQQLNELQELFRATDKRALLIVLQGLDTAGKDGVIKHVAGALNPQGCRVTGFKVPTPEELAHDFMWRIHKATPPRGLVGIFNRSHYEDVLVVRVEELVPEEVWRKRYKAINQFERHLAENGTIILKFFLHVSKEKQKERLDDRLVNPRDQWKFSIGDLTTRAKWGLYTEAYEDALAKCSTDYAPWYVIPADRKWYRNLVVSEIIAETLQSLEMQWPPLDDEAEGITIV